MGTPPHRFLTPAEKVHLRHLVEGLEHDTGVEIAVLVTSHVDDIEGFAAAYFDGMGIGKSGHDNGVLVLVAVERRLVRIEVGRGLAEVIPPAAARRIIEDVMAPLFRRGRYGEGLLRGVEAAARLVRGAQAPPAQAREDRQE